MCLFPAIRRDAELGQRRGGRGPGAPGHAGVEAQGGHLQPGAAVLRPGQGETNSRPTVVHCWI